MVDKFVSKVQAVAYAKFRYSISKEAVDDTILFLKEKYPLPLTTAVDVGCGTGISTRLFAPYFKNVIGLDISEAQLEQAKLFPDNPPNIKYRTSIAETLPLEDSTVQLVTACSALHWFDLDKFFPEVKRVLVDNGILMVSCGGGDSRLIADTPEKSEKLHSLHHKFWFETLKPFWDERYSRSLESFKSVAFPFKQVERKEYVLRKSVSIRNRIAFYESVSAFQNMKQANPLLLESHVKELIKSSEEIIGDLDTEITHQITSYLILCRK